MLSNVIEGELFRKELLQSLTVVDIEDGKGKDIIVNNKSLAGALELRLP